MAQAAYVPTRVGEDDNGGGGCGRQRAQLLPAQQQQQEECPAGQRLVCLSSGPHLTPSSCSLLSVVSCSLTLDWSCLALTDGQVAPVQPRARWPTCQWAVPQLSWSVPSRHRRPARAFVDPSCRGRKRKRSPRGARHGGCSARARARGGGVGEDDDGGWSGRQRAQLLRAAVGAAALLPARPGAAAVPARRRHRQAHRRVRCGARRTRCGGHAAVRGGGPEEERPARHRQGQAALRPGERRRVRGGGRRRKERALRGRRDAPRRDARRRQPRLRRHQKGCAWECQRLLCPSCTLHCDDSKETKAQELRYGLYCDSSMSKCMYC